MENQEIKESVGKRMTKIDWLKKIMESNHEDLKNRIDKLIEEFKCLQEIDEFKKHGTVPESLIGKTDTLKNTKILDDDMMVAVLIASIDYQEEIKKDVKLVSVKEL